jgi:hypothetical protein
VVSQPAIAPVPKEEAGPPVAKESKAGVPDQGSGKAQPAIVQKAAEPVVAPTPTKAAPAVTNSGA